jgi:hypothetical protein
MRSNLQLYLQAITTVLLMSMIGVISGFIAAAITGDRTITIATGSAMTVLTGAILAACSWWRTRAPMVLEENVPSK